MARILMSLMALCVSMSFGWESVVCDADGLQMFPQAVPDGGGGVLCCFQDSRPGRSSSAGFEAYAQRVSGSGQRLWADTTRVSLPRGNQKYGHRLSAAACPGGLGEVICCWVNHHSLKLWSGDTFGIYVQKVRSDSLQWPGGSTEKGPVFVSFAITPPTICSDGAGGCVVAWIASDRKTVMATRLNADGAKIWDPVDVVVRPPDVPGAGNKLVRNVKVVWGVDGAYVFWWDYRDHLWTESPPRYVVRFYCIQVDSAGNKSGLTLLDTFDESYGQPLRPYAVCGGANCAYVTWADETYSGDCLNGKILASTLKCARVTGSGATSSVITGESYTPGLDRLLPHIEGLDIAFAQGNFCVVWAEKEGNFDVKASIRSGTDCSLVSTRQLSSASYDDRYPQVVAKDATEFIAVWQVIHSSTDIRYQWSKFTPTQQTLMDEFGQQGYANGNFDVAAVGSAGAIAAWSTGMGWDIWAKSLEW